MALDHRKMRRILDKYWREPGRSLARQWDGVENLQAYLNEVGVTNATAAEVAAKESEYDVFAAKIPETQKDVASEEALEESPLRKALVDALLDLENRIRALEGGRPATRDKVRDDLKTRIKAHM